jgi:hypothetical protein
MAAGYTLLETSPLVLAAPLFMYIVFCYVVETALHKLEHYLLSQYRFGMVTAEHEERADAPWHGFIDSSGLRGRAGERLRCGAPGWSQPERRRPQLHAARKPLGLMKPLKRPVLLLPQCAPAPCLPHGALLAGQGGALCLLPGLHARRDRLLPGRQGLHRRHVRGRHAAHVWQVREAPEPGCLRGGRPRMPRKVPTGTERRFPAPLPARCCTLGAWPLPLPLSAIDATTNLQAYKQNVSTYAFNSSPYATAAAGSPYPSTSKPATGVAPVANALTAPATDTAHATAADNFTKNTTAYRNNNTGSGSPAASARPQAAGRPAVPQQGSKALPSSLRAAPSQGHGRRLDAAAADAAGSKDGYCVAGKPFQKKYTGAWRGAQRCPAAAAVPAASPGLLSSADPHCCAAASRVQVPGGLEAADLHQRPAPGEGDCLSA